MSRQGRPSGRSSGAASGGGIGAKFAEMPGRTRVLLGVLGLAVVVFGGYRAIKMLGGGTPSAAAAASRDFDSDFEALRAMSLDELTRERQKRTQALEALLRQANAPQEEVQRAQEAAFRATAALHEKQPPKDR
jgi:hypothetical protein